MFDSVKEFFGPVKDAKKDNIKPEEVGRASIFGVVSGVTVWTVISIIWEIVRLVVSDPNFSTIAESVKSLFNEKNWLAIFITVGTFVFDILRRRYLHGK